MTKMLNSENLLGDSGLEPHSTPCTADKILYNYAIEQCQAAALDELFGNPEECFQVFVHSIFDRELIELGPKRYYVSPFMNAFIKFCLIC